jgi:transcriptional regulator with XRE-family HTH domain
MSGKELKKIRRRLGWTQVQLAEAMNVTPNSVARWERDEVPIRESMATLARLLAGQKQRKGAK